MNENMLRRLIFTLVLLVPAAALAVADHFTTPLVVIRFNQPRVYYEQPLYNAMNRALMVKPEVKFNIINYYPPNPRLRMQADRNLKTVMDSIRKMGMPQDRLTVKNEAAPELSYSEVHIYVR